MPDPEIDRIQTLAEQAKHDSVTPERLANKKVGFKRYRVQNKSLYKRLNENEQPHFLFHADREEPEFNGPMAPDSIQRSLRYRVMHLITDDRWLMVAGNTDGDQICNIELTQIENTNYDAGGRFSNNQFAIELSNAHIRIPLATDYSEEDLEALSQYLRNEVGAIRGGVPIDSDEAGYTIAGEDTINYTSQDVRNRLDQLPDEAMEQANMVVAETDTVEELIPRLDDLLEEYEEEEKTLNDVVKEADSADELRRAVEKPTERARRRMKENAEASAEHVQMQVRETADKVQDTAPSIDPEEVGHWALTTSLATRPLARRSQRPAVVQLASLAIGAVTGAYKSGTSGSVLDDIDPEELGDAIMHMTEVGGQAEHIDGEAAGALLGAFNFLGGHLAPEEYAEWIQQADPEAILEGAEAGAKFATEEGGDSTRGALTGASVGLFGSYAVDTDDGFRETVDEDLYKTYLEQSHQKDSSLPE